MRCVILLWIIVWFVLLVLTPRPPLAASDYLAGSRHLAAEGAEFGWEEAKSKSLELLIEYRVGGKWEQANLGSGFLISPGGLFVTAYHVMKYCLKNRKQKRGFFVAVDCSSAHPGLRYKARNNSEEYDVVVISHLTEKDSSNGKGVHTPDEIIKQRDFVIGRLQAKPGKRFSYWKLRDFAEGTIDISRPRAEFELKPLRPPQKVFLIGYPADRGFSIAHGFLNVTEDRHRGYFAVALDFYEQRYLKDHGISSETSWGIKVENNMSGGVVLDSLGYVVGLVTNGRGDNTGVLSIENVLETFFSRSSEHKALPAVTLSPDRPLYLRKSAPSKPPRQAPKVKEVSTALNG